jgi:hypothetical protein
VLRDDHWTAGDFSLSCKEKELIDFTEWLHDQPFAHKIVVAGAA